VARRGRACHPEEAEPPEALPLVAALLPMAVWPQAVHRVVALLLMAVWPRAAHPEAAQKPLVLAHRAQAR